MVAFSKLRALAGGASKPGSARVLSICSPASKSCILGITQKLPRQDSIRAPFYSEAAMQTTGLLTMSEIQLMANDSLSAPLWKRQADSEDRPDNTKSSQESSSWYPARRQESRLRGIGAYAIPRADTA